MPFQKLSLNVIKFTLDSQESFTTFGSPILVEKMPHLKNILEKWSSQLFKSSPTLSSMQSQDENNCLDLATQVAFEKYDPMTKPIRSIKRTSGIEKGGDLLSILSAKALKPDPTVIEELARSQLSLQALNTRKPPHIMGESGRVVEAISSSIQSSILSDAEESEIHSSNPRGDPCLRGRVSAVTDKVNVLAGTRRDSTKKFQKHIPDEDLETLKCSQDTKLSRRLTRPGGAPGDLQSHVLESPSKQAVLKPATNEDMVKIAARLEAKANVPLDQSVLGLQQISQHELPKDFTPHVNYPVFDDGNSPALEDSEKENSQELNLPRSPNTRIEREQIIPVFTFNFLHRDLDTDAFDGMKRIPRSYVRIPETQNALLERSDLWIQSEISSDVPYGNIPSGVLADLRSFIARNPGQGSTTQGISRATSSISTTRLYDGNFDNKSKHLVSEAEKLSGNDEKMLYGINKEPDSESENSNGNPGEPEQPPLPRNSGSPITNIADMNDDHGKVQGISDDEDAISWASSPIRNYHVEIESNEQPHSYVENSTRNIPKSRAIIQGGFPSSCPNSDDELPMDVPHVIGEEVEEDDVEILENHIGSPGVPSTLPQIHPLVQVKRTPFQNLRLSKTQTGDDKYANRKRLSSSNEEGPQISSDSIIPATFKEVSSGVPVAFMQGTSGGDPQVHIAIGPHQGLDLSQNTGDEVDGESDEILANQQLYSEIAGSQLSANRHSTPPWGIPEHQILVSSTEFNDQSTMNDIIAKPIGVSPSVLETPLRKVVSNEQSPSRNSRSRKRDATAAATSSHSVSSFSKPHAKRLKRNRLAMMDFGECPDEDESPKDIYEMLRADRYKYKPSSDTQSRHNNGDSLYVSEPTSAQPIPPGTADSLDFSKQFHSAAPVSALEVPHSGIDPDPLSHQSYFTNNVHAAITEPSGAVENPMNVEITHLKSEPETCVVLLPTAREDISPVLSQKMELTPMNLVSNGLSPRIQVAKFQRPHPTAYEFFKNTYDKCYAATQTHCTEYIGTQKQFTWALVYLDHLAQGRNKRFLKRNLWDDFIRVLAADFQEYVRQVTRLKSEDPTLEVLVGIEFYNDQDEEVKFKNMVITPENLQDALDSLNQEEVRKVKEAFKARPKDCGFGPSSQNSRSSTPSTAGLPQTIFPSTASTPNDQASRPDIGIKISCSFACQGPEFNGPRAATRNPFFETHSQIQAPQPEDEETQSDNNEEVHNPDVQILRSIKRIPRSVPSDKSRFSQPSPNPNTRPTIVPLSSPPIELSEYIYYAKKIYSRHHMLLLFADFTDQQHIASLDPILLLPDIPLIPSPLRPSKSDNPYGQALLPTSNVLHRRATDISSTCMSIPRPEHITRP